VTILIAQMRWEKRAVASARIFYHHFASKIDLFELARTGLHRNTKNDAIQRRFSNRFRSGSFSMASSPPRRQLCILPLSLLHQVPEAA
jgi:hypothetical protein